MWVTVVYCPPFFLIVFLKRHVVSIQNLSSYDILQGITDEWSSFAVWGNLDRKAARTPQLIVQGHFFLVFGSFCIWKAVSPITDPSADVRVFAVSLLCMGIFSVTLYLSDMFYMDVDSQDNPETEAADLELLRDTTMERCRTPARHRRSDTRPEMAWPGLASVVEASMLEVKGVETEKDGSVAEEGPVKKAKQVKHKGIGKRTKKAKEVEMGSYEMARVANMN